MISDVSVEPESLSGEHEECNPGISVQTTTTTFKQTENAIEDAYLIEQKGKGLPIDEHTQSNMFESGSPEILSPPSILLKEAGDGSNQAEISTLQLGIEKQNHVDQVKVSSERISTKTYVDKLTDFKENSRGKNYYQKHRSNLSFSLFYLLNIYFSDMQNSRSISKISMQNSGF